MTTPPPYTAHWSPAVPDRGRPHGDAPAAYPARYPVRLRDGSCLDLPLRPLPGGEKAVALLMANQTGFAVERALADRLTALVGDATRQAPVQAVAGVPTMGLAYARPVAEGLGLLDYVALGHSRKFWYDDALSQPVSSYTSPDQTKRLYLDPALVSRVQGRRVALVDDVLNTGHTIAAAIRLLTRAGAEIVAVAAILTEGWDWHATLAALDPALPAQVRALGHIPLFTRTPAGWAPLPGTDRQHGPTARNPAAT